MSTLRHRALFVGDIVPNASRRPSDAVRNLIRSFGVDSVVGNCEISLTERGTPSPKFVTWRTHPSAAAELRRIGFDVVSLANNHMFDYGREGLEDTLTALRTAGVEPVGAGRCLDEAAAAAILGAANGPHVAVLGVACTLPLGSPADTDRPGVQPIHVSTSYEFDPTDLQEEPGCQPTRIHTQPDLRDLDRVCKQIRSLREEGHSVVVSIHWGNAFQKQIAGYQPVLAAAFAEAGCDAVIGHHPHTIHGIECIGDMPVFYSLGNFLMDAEMVGHADAGLPSGLATPWIMSSDGLAVLMEFSEHGLQRAIVRPIRLDEDGYPAALKPAEANQLLREVGALPPGRPPWTIDAGQAVIAPA